MLKDFIKHGQGKENFMKVAKRYFVNMTSNSKVLHIKGSKNCPYSFHASDYIDFDSEKEARDFFERYEKQIVRCERCFK